MTDYIKIPRMSNDQINYYLYRIYHLLKFGNINITIRRIKKTRGLALGRNIWLNPDHPIHPTLIHECLHLLYWHRKHKWVGIMEERIARRISEQQIRKLLLLMAARLRQSKPLPTPPM